MAFTVRLKVGVRGLKKEETSGSDKTSNPNPNPLPSNPDPNLTLTCDSDKASSKGTEAKESKPIFTHCEHNLETKLGLELKVKG